MLRLLPIQYIGLVDSNHAADNLVLRSHFVSLEMAVQRHQLLDSEAAAWNIFALILAEDAFAVVADHRIDQIARLSTLQHIVEHRCPPQNERVGLARHGIIRLCAKNTAPSAISNISFGMTPLNVPSSRSISMDCCERS